MLSKYTLSTLNSDKDFVVVIQELLDEQQLIVAFSKIIILKNQVVIYS